MQIKRTRVYADNQEKAPRFSTEGLGLGQQADFHHGLFPRWIIAPLEEPGIRCAQ
jgi:hypothetical protein